MKIVVKILFVSCLMILVQKSFSQEELDFIKADKSTYNAYMEQRWKDVIDTAEMAIAKGFDFYYMRMRAGIACSELKKYRKAIIHYNKALEFNSGDATATNQLYEAYIKSGFHHQAAWLMANDSVKPRKFTAIIPEAGYNINNSYAVLKTAYQKPDANLNYFFEKDLSGPFAYYSIAFIHELSPKWQVDQSFSYLTMDKFKQIHFDRNVLLNPGHIIFENSYKTTQYAWYLNPVYYKEENRQISFFLHGFLINSDAVNYNVVGAIMPQQQGPVNPQPLDYMLAVDSSKSTLFEIAGGLSFKKHRTYFMRSLQFSAYKGTDVFRFQAGLSYTLYPFAKPCFSSESSLYALLGTDNGIVFKQNFHINILSSFSADLYGMAGNMSYFADNNGAIVYNLPDVMRLKAGITLQYFPLKKIGITAGYSFSQSETKFVWNEFRGFTNKGQVRFDTNVELHKYTNHLIFGGIIWVL